MLNVSKLLSRIDSIPGWLAEPAAQLSIWLFEILTRNGVEGPMLEIGVFKGKFLALMRAANEGKLIGVDLCPPEFAESARREIIKNIETVAGHSENVEILIADSRTLTTADILAKLGAPASFIHIDGGHDVETVFHDLTVAVPTLAPGGIVAMDDAFNFSLPGVIEGTCRYFDRERGRLAPFAYCYNKLFATTPDHHETYLRASFEFMDHAVSSDIASKTRHRYEENCKANFVTAFAGYEILPFM